MVSFVLVPGELQCAQHWDMLAEVLQHADGVDVFTVDFSGLDASCGPPKIIFDLHLAAVLSTIDKAQGAVMLLGHSMAGHIVTAAAEERSSCIQKVIFLAAETLPGAPSFTLEPQAPWMTKKILEFRLDTHTLSIANGKAEQVAAILFSGASDDDRVAAVRLLRAASFFPLDNLDSSCLDKYWQIPKAYIKCTQDQAILPEHQEAMYSRLQEGALSFDLECDHCPFVSCPQKLAQKMLEIAAMPALQFQPLRQLCETAWKDPADRGVHIELLATGARAAQDPVASAVTSDPPVSKYARVQREDGGKGQQVAYRISKSRRDSTLAKVLKFPTGVSLGAPVYYWYESYVDDPGQYTNSSLNVPERGHELPLDVAGISRSLCAQGNVTFVECSRVSFSWQAVVTKRPGEVWTHAKDTEHVWGIDGREWNGSYTNGESETFVEHLNKYTKGDAEAFWEDVPKKATNLLPALE